MAGLRHQKSPYYSSLRNLPVREMLKKAHFIESISSFNPRKCDSFRDFPRGIEIPEAHLMDIMYGLNIEKEMSSEIKQRFEEDACLSTEDLQTVFSKTGLTISEIKWYQVEYICNFLKFFLKIKMSQCTCPPLWHNCFFKNAVANFNNSLNKENLENFTKVDEEYEKVNVGIDETDGNKEECNETDGDKEEYNKLIIDEEMKNDTMINSGKPITSDKETQTISAEETCDENNIINQAITPNDCSDSETLCMRFEDIKIMDHDEPLNCSIKKDI